MRIVLGILSALVFIIVYMVGISRYLESLPNPWVMGYILGCSLGIALIYDIKGGLHRWVLVNVITTVLLFALASFAAIEVREVYMSILAELDNISPEDLAKAGYENYVSAAKNPAVGIGTCFAVSLALLRLTLTKPISKLVQALLIKDQPSCCHACGQRI